MTGWGELASTLVRPLVTLALVAAQIWLGIAWAIGWDGKEPFAALGAFTMFALVFWFKDRTEGHASAATVAAVAAVVSPSQPVQPPPQG